MKTLFLSAPHNREAHYLHRELDAALTLSRLDGEVGLFSPYQHGELIAESRKTRGEPWARQIASQNFMNIERSHAILAVLNGQTPSAGVCIEIGFAIAINKPIFLLRTDRYVATNNPEFPFNLMIAPGLPAGVEMKYYFTNISDLISSNPFQNWAHRVIGTLE